MSARSRQRHAKPRVQPVKATRPQGKRCWATQKLRYSRADAASAVMAAAIPLRPYLCVHCNRWHLTSKGA